VFKNFIKNMLVFTRCMFTIPQILRTKFGIETEKQKRESNKNSVTKKTKVQMTLFMYQFVLFVPLSNLVLKSLGMINTYLMNTRIF
jgi:hypothetical protein